MTVARSASLFEEDEEDIEGGLPPTLRDEFRDAIVYNLDWTIATVVNQLGQEAIDMQPAYQRRDAWTVVRKSRLIESFILGIPVPPIVLAERPERKGTFLVLDGKQRLTTLAQFTGTLSASPLNNFALTDLPLLPQLNGVTYKQLTESASNAEFKHAFLNQSLKTAIVRGWRSAELLHVVFHRLNSQVVPLSPQELRQAIIQGPFMGFLNNYSADSSTMRWLLDLDGPDFRMRDSELLLRLLGLTQYRDRYRGDLRKFLDEIALDLSGRWHAVENDTIAALRRIEDAIELWGIALGREFVGRKFIEGKFERRLNRAVLDAQVYAALSPEVAAKIRSHPEAVKGRFEYLMSTDDEFRRAIEATTKSVGSVNYRMDKLHSFLLSS